MDRPRRTIPEPELAEFLARATSALERHPQVQAAWLFGSAARGEAARDLDIALLLDRARTEPWFLERVAADIEHAAGGIDSVLDLRPLRGATPRFRATVLKEGRLFHDAVPEARWEFEAATWSEWLDFKPVWERVRKEVLERWSRG
jgi:predicted nucleotidyltransferase